MSSESGKLIVFEGLDGSGKATQTELFFHDLINRGETVRKLSFPNYESDSSALVKMYLGGDFGTKPKDVNAYAASAFYAVDRYASFKQDWGADYRAGTTLICDRYTTSNALHQCSKLPRDKWEAYLEWLTDFEHGKLGIPQPDAVVYLDVDLAVSQRLLEKQYASSGGTKDIHELDKDYLRSCCEAARFCAEYFAWQVVLCSPDGYLRDIEDIRREIAKILGY